jgi:hypothetical protein
MVKIGKDCISHSTILRSSSTIRIYLSSTISHTGLLDAYRVFGIIRQPKIQNVKFKVKNPQSAIYNPQFQHPTSHIQHPTFFTDFFLQDN